MTDETNAYAVKINGVTFISMDAAKSLVDEARKDAWNLALEEAATKAEVYIAMGWRGDELPAAIRALKENADDKT